MSSTDWLTLSLVLITAYYAYQTRRTVKLMEEANEANNRPVVSVTVINDRPQGVSFIDLVVCNSGNSLAKNTTLSIKGDDLEIENIGSRKRMLSELMIIQKGIKVLAPGESRRTWLLSAIGRTDELLSKVVEIEVAYENADRTRTYSDTFVLDFASLPHIQLGHDPIDHIDKEIEKIRKILGSKQ